MDPDEVSRSTNGKRAQVPGIEMLHDEEMSGAADADFNPSDPTINMLVDHARRLARICDAHVRLSMKVLSKHVAAPPTSPAGEDRARALAQEHLLAYRARQDAIEALSNTVSVHVLGLRTLLHGDVLPTLALVPLARSLAEAVATLRWLIEPGISSDARVARSYALAFNSLSRVGYLIPQADFARDEIKEAVIKHKRCRIHLAYEEYFETGDFMNSLGVLEKKKYRAKRQTDDVASVAIGGAKAQVSFRYSHRLKQQIPSLGNSYRELSAMTHGEDSVVGLAWDDPGPVLRLVAFVLREAVTAWSDAVHDWIGATRQSPVVSTGLWASILDSMPTAQRERLQREMNR